MTMSHPVELTTFLAAAYGLAIASGQILRWFGFNRWLALGLGATVFLTPLVIAPTNVRLRALACVLALELLFKITDYAAQWRAQSVSDQGFRSYAKFLIPFPVLLVRFGQRCRQLTINFPGWRRIVFALLAFGLCFVSLERMSDLSVLRSSFLLDHTIKFVVFAVALEMLSRFVLGLEHLAGYATGPLIDSAYRSKNVGEFWHRYNTRVRSWLHHNVFLPICRWRSPMWGVFATFFVSGVLHEIGFAIATSRCDGYQFAFFMLQAPAVILGQLVRRTVSTSPVTAKLLHVATVLWMWATSMLFFHGVNRVFSLFYASEPWLP